MSLTRQIAHNTIIQIIGRLISVALGIVVLALMTRNLGPLGFGYLTTILAFLQFFGILADLGLNLTTLQLISEPGANQTKILNNLVSFRTITAIIFLALAPITALFFPYPAIVKWGIALTTLSFFFTVMQQIFVGLFQKELQTIKTVAADLAGRTASLVVMLLTLWLSWNLWGALVAIILSNLINLLVLLWGAKNFVKIKWEVDWSVWQKIFSRSWPLGLTIIFNLIYFKADTIILSLFHSPTAVGLYGAPYKILEVLIQFPYLFLGLILPLLTTAWLENNKERFTKLFQGAFDFLIILALPLIFGTWVLAKPIILLIAGEPFLISAAILKILIVATSIIFISSLYGYVIVAVNGQKAMIKFYLLNALWALVAYFIFIPLYSYWGAAYLTVVVELIIALAAAYTAKRLAGLITNWQILLPTLLACLVMTGVLLMLANFNLFFSLAAGIFIYFVALYALGGVKKEIIIFKHHA